MLLGGLLSSGAHGADVTPAEARAIAKEAYTYGFPMVDNYRIQYAYFVDRKAPEFKASWNHIVNIPRAYTPADTAIQTPNSDTPYSFVGMDLRVEPVVLMVPPIEKERYFSIQLIDAYTFTLPTSAVVPPEMMGVCFSSPGRTEGRDPKGVKQVIRSETEFVFAFIALSFLNRAILTTEEGASRIQRATAVGFPRTSARRPAVLISSSRLHPRRRRPHRSSSTS